MKTKHRFEAAPITFVLLLLVVALLPSEPLEIPEEFKAPDVEWVGE
jgi:hypothetical protein